MDQESVRSGRSERSERSHQHHYNHQHHHRHPHGGVPHQRASHGDHRDHHKDHRDHRDHRDHSNHSNHSNRHSRHYGRRSRHAYDTDDTEREPRDDRSVTIRTPGPEDMLDPMPHPPPDERIEVQIIPQDDTWADNTTAITGNTSETGFSMEDLRSVGNGKEDPVGGMKCARWVGTLLAGALALAAWASPIIMVTLPRLKVGGFAPGPCKTPCIGAVVSLAFRLFMLLVATWAVFLRRPRSTLPRVYVLRALALCIIFLLTFSFWLFYGVTVIGDPDLRKSTEYQDVVEFASSLADALLFTHLALVLLEMRQQQPAFIVKIVRSPDGETRSYSLGMLSVQRSAVYALEQYYKDFTAYNPWLENAQRKHGNRTAPNFKVYDVDGAGSGGNAGGNASRAVLAASARRRDSSHNEKFYEEVEYERRLRKRRARLLVAAEEAFTHIKRLQEEPGPAIPMDPQEAAQAIFPSMARALQKYLRVSRQQPRYTMENILQHLAICIGNDLSARSFLQRYLVQEPSILNEKEHRKTQTWTLISDQLLNRSVEHNSIFHLRQGDVILSCQVRRMPHLNLREEVVDPKTNKFVLRLSSETSV